MSEANIPDSTWQDDKARIRGIFLEKLIEIEQTLTRFVSSFFFPKEDFRRNLFRSEILDQRGVGFNEKKDLFISLLKKSNLGIEKEEITKIDQNLQKCMEFRNILAHSYMPSGKVSETEVSIGVDENGSVSTKEKTSHSPDFMYERIKKGKKRIEVLKPEDIGSYKRIFESTKESLEKLLKILEDKNND